MVLNKSFKEEFLCIKPRILTFIVTYKCTASCLNCCFECNPQREEKISTDFALNLIDKAVNLFPSLATLVLTGGEAFLNLEKISKIIGHAKRKGLTCRVVTNGFWGETEDKAYRILELLKRVGLDEINFSTGDDHLEYVEINRIQNCISAALALGFTTVLNIEYGNDRSFNIEKLKDEVEGLDWNKLSIIKGLWMPFTKDSLDKLLPLHENCLHPVMDRCSNIFTGITISPDSKMFSCCGLPVKYIKYFDLGVVSKENLFELYQEQFRDFLKIWLYVEGPYKILSYIERECGINIPEIHVLSHMCFYCACLFTNPQYLNAAREIYEYKYDSVMMKYFFCK